MLVRKSRSTTDVKRTQYAESVLPSPVFRLTAREGAKLSAEAVMVEKRPFEQWLQEHSAHCTVHVGDAELKAKIARRYPELPWVRAWPTGD